MSTATATAPVKLPELHEKTSQAEEFFKKHLTLDVKEKKLNTGDAAYEQLLAEMTDIPLAMAKAVHSFDQHAIAGFAAAVTSMSNAGAKKHKDLDTVDAVLPMLGRDRFEVRYTREKEVNAGIQKAGEPPVEKKTVYGTFSTKLVVAGADTGSGELNKIAKRSKAAAMEMFGK